MKAPHVRLNAPSSMCRCVTYDLYAEARVLYTNTTPLTRSIELRLREARAALAARETRWDDETPVPGVEEATSKCFRCGGIGHWARDCPKKAKTEPVADAAPAEPPSA